VRSALIDTKFYAPKRRTGVVPRPTLTDRLSEATAKKLTLVSGPAGFGKTTLLAESLTDSRAAGPSVAWLSLDKADNDPVSFWTYVIAALQTVTPGLGAGARSLLHSSQPPPIETALRLLINDLAAESADIVLVLDDYHVVEH
jgi:LuxR family maltose regulon positive regulatory protein